MSGKRIVITSWGSLGDLYPYIGLALALRDRGHHPVLAVPRHFRPAVEREGLCCNPSDNPTFDSVTIRRVNGPQLTSASRDGGVSSS